MMPTRRTRFPTVAAAALATVLFVSCSGGDTPRTPVDSGSGGADTSPPTQVLDAGLAWDGDAAVLTWTAPADNDRVESYDIRYAYSFPLNWDLSLRVGDPPAPAAPGEAQSYRITGVQRGREMFAAIRSTDPAGNVSPVSSIAHTRVMGYTLEVACAHAFTGEPVAGLDVTITARQVHPHVTASDGSASQGDLSSGAVNVAIRPGTTGIPFHFINHPFELTGDDRIEYAMIPYQPTALGTFVSVLSLFKEAARVTPQRPVFRKWRSLPVPVYIPELVNVNGIDYRDVGRRAAERWEERTGIDLWTFATEPPDTGVVVKFRTRAFMGIQVGYTVHVNGPDGYPLANEVNIVDDFTVESSLYKTMLHEFGHTIRLFHLPAGYIMYGGQPLPDDITDDEALAVQIYTAMPNGINIGVYDDSNPDAAGGR